MNNILGCISYTYKYEDNFEIININELLQIDKINSTNNLLTKVRFSEFSISISGPSYSNNKETDIGFNYYINIFGNTDKSINEIEDWFNNFIFKIIDKMLVLNYVLKISNSENKPYLLFNK